MLYEFRKVTLDTYLLRVLRLQFGKNYDANVLQMLAFKTIRWRTDKTEPNIFMHTTTTLLLRRAGKHGYYVSQAKIGIFALCRIVRKSL